MTKRMSSLLSDAMTYNRAFSGDQRSLVRDTEKGPEVRQSQLDPLLDHVQTLIIGPLARKGEEVVITDPIALTLCLRNLYQVDEIICFSDNPLSPLVIQKPVVSNQAQVDKFLLAYEEEQAALLRALSMQPARICSPVNFAM